MADHSKDRAEIRSAINELGDALSELEFGNNAGDAPIALSVHIPHRFRSQVGDLHWVVRLTPEMARELAAVVVALNARLGVSTAGGRIDPHGAAAFTRDNPQLAADLADLFGRLDLDQLTREVLDDTAPDARMTVTRAIDAMYGDVPTDDEDDAR